MNFRANAVRFRIPSQRPEIDGLRAIAILSVVLYHANLGCFHGFIGVDIFFVISGFLITGIVLRELEEGTFSLANFWERRIRRIFPALAACLGATLVAGYFVLFPSEMRALADETISALALVANIKMRNLQSWYWAADSNTIPLLHTWSLSIEEQFYICLPVILIAAHRWAPKRTGLVLGLLFVCSIALCQPISALYGPMMHFSSGDAFYLLPFRAWELLLGSLGAHCAQNGLRIPKNIATPLAGVGLCVILWAVFDFPYGKQWPNLWTLLPLAGVLSILITPQPRGEEHIVARMLGHPIPRFVGLISYSLYLWHWPLLVLVNQSRGLENISRLGRWGLVGISIGLAAMSWRFIEQPFRQRGNCRGLPGKRVVFGCGLAWACLMIAAFWTLQNGGFEQQFAARLTPKIRSILLQPPVRDYNATGFLASGGIQFNTARQKPRCVVLGDSHGCSLGPLLETLSQEDNIPVAMLAQNACPGLFAGSNEVHIDDRGFPIDKKTRDNQVKEWITKWKPDMVILAGRWDNEMTYWGLAPADSSNTLAKVIPESTKWLAEHAGRVIILTQVPYLPFDRSNLGQQLRKLIRGEDLPILRERPLIEYNRKTVVALLRKDSDPRIEFVDITSPFKNADGSIRYCNTNGCFYKDSNHLNSNGALELRPILERYFATLRLAANR